VVDAVSAPVERVPLSACVPVHVPEPEPGTVQAVAPVDIHVRVEALPLATGFGEALISTVGSGATVTVVEATEVTPAPVQVSVKRVVLLSAPVVLEPLTATLPLQPPDAVHEEAPLEFHVSVDAWPLATMLGLALRLTVGAAPLTAVTVVDALAVPPSPLHVRL
jgi:hypothetical protein